MDKVQNSIYSYDVQHKIVTYNQTCQKHKRLQKNDNNIQHTTQIRTKNMSNSTTKTQTQHEQQDNTTQQSTAFSRNPQNQQHSMNRS